VFFYPRRGFGQIVDALAAAATEAGACIRTATAVTGLRPSVSHVDCILDDGSAVEAANAWTSLPLPVLTTIANAPEAVRAAANALEHRSLVLCYLMVARPQWTEFDAHYFPGLDVIASRVSEPKNYRSNPGDPRDVTVLCAEIPCRRDDASWNASGDALAARLVDDLVGAGLPAPPVVDVAVRRVERAYPVYRRRYAAAFSVVDDWARGLPNVLTFGRHGLFAHDNTHHAFVMADAAVDALRDDGTVDAHAWSDARDRFRHHVVED
jgi:protoporphyrinogen oxidase